MANIVLPLNIEFEEWGAQIRIDLPNVTIPNPPHVDNWKDWASQVVYSNLLSNVPLPTKNSYPEKEDWRKWAAYFINSVYS